MRFRGSWFKSMWLGLSFCLLWAVAPTSGQRERTVTKLAEGVYEIQHRRSSGNTTVIIGDRQVFVVDTCYLLSDAREDIAEIRKWTDKPVSFILNTHFHNDHNLGNRIYMDAFPAVTIIAHTQTKKEMDLFGPGSLGREEQSKRVLEDMLKTGKTKEGVVLSDEDKPRVQAALDRRNQIIDDLKDYKFQSATLAFERDFSIDVGNREVQIKFLGRGNTNGDAIVYLPKEKIVVAGDLVVSPIPYFYDGYPSEWVRTLENMAALDPQTIVPGHGPVLHDKTHLYLMRDIMKSAVDQMNEKLRKVGPAMGQTLDSVKDGVDLSSFKQRFAGNDQDLGDQFDNAAALLVKLVFEEATLR